LNAEDIICKKMQRQKLPVSKRTQLSNKIGENTMPVYTWIMYVLLISNV
jgi:hypothetical protein